MPRIKQRTPQLRVRLLDAAMETLADGGVAGFTTRRVADRAATSVPAVYELFGDKSGLIREVFFEGFRRLGRHFEALAPSDEPVADLVAVIRSFRAFVSGHPVLAQVMFAHPFAEFDPGTDELRAGTVVRTVFVDRVERCIDQGDLVGDATDIAHVVLATCQGLSIQESAGWLGRSKASIERRWTLAIDSLFAGMGSAR